VGKPRRLRRGGRHIDEIQNHGYGVSADTYHRYSLPDEEHEAADDGGFEWVGDRDAPDIDLDVAADADEPDPDDLTGRERVIVSELQTGTDVEDLADELDERPTIVTEHLRELKRRGWQVYVDESAGHVTIEGETTLRSSEHTGTRTRKANKWWELRHNHLVREFKQLDTPDTRLDGESGTEDWVVHLTDLHAGDRVRRDDGTVIYSTEDIPAVIDYVTERACSLAATHNADYDACHLLWGGDFVTNEGVYSG
jgi:biotin operon repressor